MASEASRVKNYVPAEFKWYEQYVAETRMFIEECRQNPHLNQPEILKIFEDSIEEFRKICFPKSLPARQTNSEEKTGKFGHSESGYVNIKDSKKIPSAPQEQPGLTDQALEVMAKGWNRCTIL